MEWLAGHPQPAALAVVLIGCWVAGQAWARQAELFRIVTVQAPADSPVRVPNTVIGRNIWDVDLSALAGQLKAQQPSLKYIRVTRRLPNTLRVDVVQRLPVAQVKTGGWHAVDRAGFVFPDSAAAPIDGLVMLEGVTGPGRPALKEGREHDHERLQLAFRVTEQLSRSSALGRHRVMSIDVGDPNQLLFVMDDEIEVRCGSEAELAEHLDRLKAALERIAANRLAVRYIDVRFPEPVIGPRT